MKYIIIAILVLCSLSVDAQEKSKGFYNITEYSFFKGAGSIDGGEYYIADVSNQFRTHFGTFINESWSVGLGIGSAGRSWGNAMPAFVDVHYYFKEKPYFFFMDLGYAIPWADVSFKEGIMADVGAGVKLKTKKKNWLISFSHNSQQLKDYDNTESIVINNFAINVGLLFD